MERTGEEKWQVMEREELMLKGSFSPQRDRRSSPVYLSLPFAIISLLSSLSLLLEAQSLFASHKPHSDGSKCSSSSKEV